MTIGPETVVVQDKEPIATKLDDEIVMLSPRAEAYFGLGEVGSEIWNLISEPRRVADICAKLCDDYDIDAATCERDVIGFLSQLLDRHLIRVIGGDGPGS